MNDPKQKIIYADDDTYSVRALAWMRLPSLFVGLLLGVALSFVTSRFETVLTQHIEVAFFIPLVVYMASAVGNQTQSIYVRDLRTGRAKFKNYLLKESMLGLILGAVFGLASWLLVMIWFDFARLAVAVGLAMGVVITVAPVIALVVAEVLWFDHKDPAVGAGPIATVIQDTVSVIMYGLITTAIILR